MLISIIIVLQLCKIWERHGNSHSSSEVWYESKNDSMHFLKNSQSKSKVTNQSSVTWVVCFGLWLLHLIASFVLDCKNFEKKCPTQTLQSDVWVGMPVLHRFASFESNWHPLHVGIVQICRKYQIVSFALSDCDVFSRKLEIQCIAFTGWVETFALDGKLSILQWKQLPNIWWFPHKIYTFSY